MLLRIKKQITQQSGKGSTTQLPGIAGLIPHSLDRRSLRRALCQPWGCPPGPEGQQGGTRDTVGGAVLPWVGKGVPRPVACSASLAQIQRRLGAFPFIPHIHHRDNQITALTGGTTRS